MIKVLIKKLLYPTHFKRFLFFFLADIVICIFSLYLAFLLRFDFTLNPKYQEMFLRGIPLFLLIKIPIFDLFRMYKITWRYVGLSDLLNIIYAVFVAEAILLILIWTPYQPFLKFLPLSSLSGFPRSIFIIDGSISILLLSGLRISRRLLLEVILKKSYRKGKRTLIVGAGNTGEMILRDLARNRFSDFYPIGFLDDDPNKIGTYLHGVKVLGSIDYLKGFIYKYQIEAIIIAIPSLDYKTLRKIYTTAKDAKVKIIKIVPRIYDFHHPEIWVKNLEDIKIEDLLGRQMVEVDYKEIEAFIKDKVVLVTGAGGSIGSEIARQVYAFHPKKLLLLDIDETELHNLGTKLKGNDPQFFRDEKLRFIVADIREREKIEKIFEKYKPCIVFHAAAYKHVPLMEYNAVEAVKANIFGTYNVALASVRTEVEKFIFISTDKAINPTSVMGATKRMAELICQAFNSTEEVKTEFISVRFGNVLGSRGSVLPLFLEQLKHGGPLTVTHPEMKRYFMTIPEAVSLVLQASVIGKRGEVLVLDMGEPVKILQIAEEIIRLHGFEPYRDIDIKFVGLRPGEKLFEELFTAKEGTIATKHRRVFIVKTDEKYNLAEIEEILEEFQEAITNPDDNTKVKELLKKYVTSYQPPEILV